MNVYSHEQYPQLSPEWWALRCGKPSSSEAHRIITAKDAKPSASQAKYAEELVMDLQNQCPKYFTAKGHPINKHTDYGRDMEGEARTWFAQSSFCDGMELHRVGLIETDDGRFVASPDFLLKKDGKWVGGGEIKNYGIIKHAKYRTKATLTQNYLPLEVKAQVHHCLAVSELFFWFWVSYNPEPELSKVVTMVQPDAFTEALKVQLEAFDVLLQDMKRKAGLGPKENSVTAEGQQAVNDWKEFIASKPEINSLNEQLPKLANVPEAKHDIWFDTIRPYADSRGWILPDGAKAFVEPAVA